MHIELVSQVPLRFDGVARERVRSEKLASAFRAWSHGWHVAREPCQDAEASLSHDADSLSQMPGVRYPSLLLHRDFLRRRMYTMIEMATITAITILISGAIT
jgi:hypothetical protein